VLDDGPELAQKWATLRAVRAEVLKKLEDMRTAKEIGASLQAEVEIRASGEKLKALQSLGNDLRFVLITSQATVTHVEKAEDEAIIATASKHAKCERCWHYRSDVGADKEHATLCGRCVSNLFGKGEPRGHA
jgi:isoleucyl-tRNA synthetase